MYCVMTRFHLKHFWHLPSLYRAYRKMHRDLSIAPGLVRHVFLFENPRIFYTISIWESENAIKKFSNVPSHIAVLRRSIPLCRTIWSGYWYLDHVSKSASSWPGTVLWPLPTISSEHLQAFPNKI